jgi:hypothetical protein
VGLSQMTGLIAALARATVLFQVTYQCRTETAVGQFLHEGGRVALENGQRFLTDAQRLAIAGETDDAAGGDVGNRFLKRLIHLCGRHDRVAQH